MIVMKFGGSSLASKAKINQVVSIVGSQTESRPVVVVSAHGGMTDCLIRSAKRALTGRADLTEFNTFHADLVNDLGLDMRLIEPLTSKLIAILRGVSLVRELTPKTMDHILSFGERLSSKIMAAALTSAGCKAQAVNAYDLGFISDSNFGSAVPLPGVEETIGKELAQMNRLPVVTGFIAKDEKGDITTIGRNGSDYTAAVMGAAVNAEEVQIWTDVDGVMTADPSIDDKAQGLPVLSFTEASELAYYGAEVIHTGTLVPAISNNIPVRVANTTRPGEPGTRIEPRPVLGGRIAKSIAYKEDVCLISVASPRLMSASKLLPAALAKVADLDIGVHIAATSVSSVSLVTDRHYEQERLDKAVKCLSELGEVTLEMEKAIICVVGEELRGRPGVLGKIFSVVGGAGIKARMVAQSASEINVAFLVDNSEIKDAVRAVHSVLLEGWTPEAD